jgi:hypothetical protein
LLNIYIYRMFIYLEFTLSLGIRNPKSLKSEKNNYDNNDDDDDDDDNNNNNNNIHYLVQVRSILY